MSEKCGVILRIWVLAFRADIFALIAVSFSRTLLPQMGIPWMMPKEIFQLDFHGVPKTLVVLLDVYVLLSYSDISVLYGCWALMFVLTVNDLVDGMR